MSGSKFIIGDKVRKVVGYPFEGTVVMVSEDQEKCSVRHKDGWEHIFSDKQLAYDHPEYQYLDLLRDCLENGVYREGRNGGTYGLFGRQMRFDLQEGFPLLTTKRLHTKSIFGELLWMLRGSTNNNDLLKDNITIWDEWADVSGDLGPIYGKQWRNWTSYDMDEDGEYYPIRNDQIYDLLENLKSDPYSRRHVVSAWNVGDLDAMALAPCHCLFQFFVANDRLSCQLYQRSCDIFLGCPFNVASYALLTHMIAKECNLEVGELVHTFGDVHLYANHMEQAREQLTREPIKFPTISLRDDKDIFSYNIKDIWIRDYNAHPSIKADVSK